MDSHYELSQVLREAFGNDLVKLFILFPTQKAQTACTFLPLANKSSGVDGHLAIADTFPIAERNKGFVAIGSGCRLALFAEPALKFLGRQI